MRGAVALAVAFAAVINRARRCSAAPGWRERARRARRRHRVHPAAGRRASRSSTSRQQALAYWLTQASIAIDPIIYDQLSRFGLRQKRLLEEIVARPSACRTASRSARSAHTRCSSGPTAATTTKTPHRSFCRRSPPTSCEAAALRRRRPAVSRRAYADLPPLATPAARDEGARRAAAGVLRPRVRADDHREDAAARARTSSRRARTLLPGRHARGSEGLHRSSIRSTRAWSRDATAICTKRSIAPARRTARVPPGLYASILKKAIGYLEKARAVADPAQAAVIAALIRFYQTGDPETGCSSAPTGCATTRRSISPTASSRSIATRAARRAARRASSP